jgi:outer membrane receptor protein involved in Fe transport
VKSKSTWIVNAEVGYKFSDRLRLTLESYNIFDVAASDIDYYFESRLQGEPEAVEDIHFHAAIPRSARLALHMSF